MGGSDQITQIGAVFGAIFQLDPSLTLFYTAGVKSKTVSHIRLINRNMRRINLHKHFA